MRLGRPNPARVGALILALAVGVAGACAKDADAGPTAELDGWRRGDVWRQPDVAGAYDRVAVRGHLDGISWVTRAGDGGAGLAHWEMASDGSVERTALAMPPDPVAIPIDVAGDLQGWAVVAVTRDQPTGHNTGLVAWRASLGEAPAAAEPLAMPEDGLPDRVVVGRAHGTSIVAGVTQGDLVTWLHDGDSGGWQTGRPDLGPDVELVTADLAGDSDRFLLAGVDADGRGHLWSSTDGVAWTALDGDLPSGLASVRLLGPLAVGETAVGWLAAGGEDAPFSGPSVQIQRVNGEAVIDEGTIRAEDVDVPAVSVAGAAVSPDDALVVVGAAWPEPGHRSPMLWVRLHDGWQASRQTGLVDRTDHELRAITSDWSTSMTAIVTPFPQHVDVEAWEWRAPGS